MSDRSNWQWASMHRRFAVGRDGKTANERNVGRRAVPPLAQFGERVWWMALQPSTVVWALWIHDLNKEGTWDRWIDRTQCFRTIERLPPGERWTGSLLDEALGSELTPNALEDDGGRVGIRALVLQPHAAVPLPPLAPEIRHMRRAPFRRTDIEQFGYTGNCPRAGREHAMDHSEHCRSRMEAIWVTTTEGHERLQRARDRFAMAAKDREDEEPQRKRHRPEGEGRQPLAPSASGVRSNYQEGRSSSSSGSALLPPPAPPPLEEIEMTDVQPSNNRESQRGEGSIQKYLKPRTAVAVAAAAVKAQPTLKWDWWMCVRFSVEIPRGLRGNL